MKKKVELLKIYSAYLPYELKLQHLWVKAKHKPETTLRSWVKDLQPLDLGCFFPNRNDSFDWKPILYSMDMLTKEIEHKGEKFIPIVYLYNLSNEQHFNTKIDYELIDSWGAGKILKVLHSKKGEYTEFIYNDFTFRKDRHYEAGSYVFGIDLPHAISVMQEIKNQKWMHQKLLEWRFNVFGLSESEYIKKEYLK